MFSVFGAGDALFHSPMEAVQRRMRPLSAAAAPAADPLAEHMDDVAAQPFARCLFSGSDETLRREPDHGTVPAPGLRLANRGFSFLNPPAAPSPHRPACLVPSSAPGGCASKPLDGVDGRLCGGAAFLAEAQDSSTTLFIWFAPLYEAFGA